MRVTQSAALLFSAFTGLAYAGASCQWAWQSWEVTGTFKLVNACTEGDNDITAEMDMNKCLVALDNQLKPLSEGYAFDVKNGGCDYTKCSISGPDDTIDCTEANCGKTKISDAVSLDGNNIVCATNTATASTVNVYASATPAA